MRAVEAECASRASPSFLLQRLFDQREIGGEALERFIAFGLVRDAQDRRRMHRGKHEWRHAAFHQLPTLNADSELASQESLRSGRTEAHDHMRMQQRYFRLEPIEASCDFALCGRLVNAPLAARLPLKCLTAFVT